MVLLPMFPLLLIEIMDLKMVSILKKVVRLYIKLFIDFEQMKELLLILLLIEIGLKDKKLEIIINHVMENI